MSRILKNRLLNFYPRTPAGCDPNCFGSREQYSYFYPRTPAGCDYRHRYQWATEDIFLSTHPCGVRLELPRAVTPEMDFYPRTPAGCDASALSANYNIGISIHAPLRGATSSGFSIAALLYFYPRTPAGCD